MWTVLLACAGSTALAAGISAVGCEERSTLTPTGGGNGGGGAGGAADAGPDLGRLMFDDLETDFVNACGGCHDAGGIADTPFLKAPRYETITAWPGIVTKDPTESKLETHPIAGGGHAGTTNLDSDGLKNTLFPKIKAWLEQEAKAIAATPADQKGKSIDPFVPILGFNAIYLTPLGANFSGMAITFNATELTANSLELNDIEVHTTVKQGLHLVHPLFSVYPKNGNPDPDPADSFSNLDQYVDYSKSDALGPGTLILTNWVADGKLQLSFEKIEEYSTLEPDAGMDGGVTGGCKDIDSFNQNAKGQFNTCFTNCHGGQNGQATSAVDMTGLVNDANVANGCAQIRNRVNPDDPPQSQLFVTTDPDGTAAHPYKFAQKKDEFNAFKSAVSTWIAAEK